MGPVDLAQCDTPPESHAIEDSPSRRYSQPDSGVPSTHTTPPLSQERRLRIDTLLNIPVRPTSTHSDIPLLSIGTIPDHELVSDTESVSSVAEPRKLSKELSLGFFSAENGFRQWCFRVTESFIFDVFILIVIAYSIVLVVLDVESPSDADWFASFLLISDIVVLVLFSLEILLKSISYGFIKSEEAYLKDPLNVLDFIIVLFGLIAYFPRVPDDFELARIGRLLRVLRIALHSDGLKNLLKAIAKALPLLSQTFLLLIFFLFLFGTMGLQLFGTPGDLHERCVPLELVDSMYDANNETILLDYDPGYDFCDPFYNPCDSDHECLEVGPNPLNRTLGFDNVFEGILTVFITITQEGFSEILMVLRQTSNVYLAEGFIIITIIVCSFLILNLFVGAISETVGEIQDELRMRQKRRRQKKRRLALLKSISTVVSLSGNSSFDVPKPEPPPQKKPPSIFEKLVQHRFFEAFVLVCVLVNTVVLCIPYAGMSTTLYSVLEVINKVFTLIFTAEMILKHIALGFHGYWSDLWNVLDGLIVIFSLSEILGGSLGTSVFTALRSLRILRAIKLAKHMDSLKELVQVILDSTVVLGYFLLLSVVFVVFFAILGLVLFKDYVEQDSSSLTFDSFISSALLVFQALTGENWNALLPITIEARGWAIGLGYTLPCFILGNFLLINLLISLVIDKFSESHKDKVIMTESSRASLAFPEITHSSCSESSFAIPDVKEIDSSEYSDYPSPSILSPAIDSHPAPQPPYFSTLIEETPRGVLVDHVSSDEEPHETLQLPDFDYDVTMNNLPPFNPTLPSVLSLEHLDQVATSSVELEAPVSASEQSILDAESSQLGYWERMFRSHIYELCLTILIVSASLATLFDLQIKNTTGQRLFGLLVFDIIVTFLFIIEAILKICVFGKKYFKDSWNVFDLTIICLCLCSVIWSSMSVFKVARSFRMIRIVPNNSYLQTITKAVVGSLRSVFQITILIFFTLTICAVIGSSLFQGRFNSCNDSSITNLTACTGSFLDPETNITTNRSIEGPESHQSFDSYPESLLTLFSILSLEGYPDQLWYGISSSSDTNIPIFVENRFWVSIYFIIITVLTSFLMLNVLIAVVIDSFFILKNENTGDFQLTATQRQYLAALKRAKNTVKIVKTLKPSTRFGQFLLDTVEARWFSNSILILIVLNGLSLSLYTYRMNATFKAVLDGFNYFCTVVFAVEAVLKICALRSKWKRDPWNLFDAAIVIVSIPELFFYSNLNLTLLRLIRLLRVLRVFRFVRLFDSFRIVVAAFTNSIPSLLAILFLMFLLFSIYGAIGMSLFGTITLFDGEGLNEHYNFQTIPRMLSTLFRILCGGDGYLEIMHDCAVEEPECVEPYCGNAVVSYIYFVSFVFLGTFCLLSYIIAIIIDGFSEAMNSKLVDSQSVAELRAAWERYDQDADNELRWMTALQVYLDLPSCIWCDSMDPVARIEKFRQIMPLMSDGVSIHFTLFFDALLQDIFKIDKERYSTYFNRRQFKVYSGLDIPPKHSSLRVFDLVDESHFADLSHSAILHKYVGWECESAVPSD